MEASVVVSGKYNRTALSITPSAMLGIYLFIIHLFIYLFTTISGWKAKG